MSPHPGARRNTNNRNPGSSFPIKGLLVTIALAALPAGCASSRTAGNAVQHEAQRSTTMSTKETVGAFLGAVMRGDAATMRQLANTDYIQHNPYVPTGLEPFIQMLPVLQENGTTAENVRMFQDGNYVFMHNIWRNAKPFGADEMVAFDILRVDDNGKVAEHWDVMMPQTPPNPSGRTLTDGTTAIDDIDKTETNKAQVRRLFDVLIHGTPEQVGAAVQANFSPDYKQHNPAAADGLQGFMAAMPSEQWVFKKQHKVLGEGNFVLSISEGTHKGEPAAFYDLVRLENGVIVEHWDVIQPVPFRNLANSNTMFGF
jgi:predicted SnoaL-like aldol condensation-catalyzing enzyme